jgi:hypothetical protein
MNPSQLARSNAISFECKKDALQQRQSGDWKISFTVQGADMDERITRAAMGTRFMAVLVEIGDDELPVQHPVQHPEKSGRDWRDLKPAQQAGIRCGDPKFIAFLKEEHEPYWTAYADPAKCVRSFCSIESRSELNTVHQARILWHQLDKQYQAWEVKERS